MISIRQQGDFKNIEKFLKQDNKRLVTIFENYGRKGVAALSAATPKDTGKTASAWNYEVKYDKEKIILYFTNSNVVKGVPIALILQYGHGTGKGGFVKGINYINPTLKPIFDGISSDIWREVTNA